MSERVLLSLAFLAVLTACYGNTRFVAVEPVRFVPAPDTPVPNMSFGWVETTADQAERFRVIVGNLDYREIIEPHKIDGDISYEAAVSALATFAEEEVVRRGLCASASTPEDARRIIGGNTPPQMWIYVQCAE